MNRLVLAGLASILLSFGGACSTTKTPPARSISPKPAPEFTIQTLNGETLDSKDLKGKIVIINFWAVWSPACAREIPELIQLCESFGTDKDRIAIVGICLESKNLNDVESFSKQLGVNYPVSLQDNSFTEQFGGIDALPTSFIIDPDWNLVNRYTGKFPLDELRYELSYMLDELKNPKKAEAQ